MLCYTMLIFLSVLKSEEFRSFPDNPVLNLNLSSCYKTSKVISFIEILLCLIYFIFSFKCKIFCTFAILHCIFCINGFIWYQGRLRKLWALCMISWGPPLSAINKNLTYKTNSRPGRGGGAIRKFSPWKIGHRVFGLQITGAHFQYCIYRSKDKEFPFLTYM
jgi:hypothetical protein